MGRNRNTNRPLEGGKKMRRIAIVGGLAIIIVVLMILTAIPNTIGSTQEKRAARGQVIEIGTDVQHLPPQTTGTGTFLPFMKHEIGYGGGARGLLIYRYSILQNIQIFSQASQVIIGLHIARNI